MSMLKCMKILEKIDQGTFSKVYKVLHTQSQQYYALKVLLNPNNVNHLANEAKILSQLNHEGIIKTLEFKLNNSKNQFLLQEYCHTMLLNLLMMEKFSEKLARTLLHQIVESLEYLHNKGIYHLDIKSENILIDQNYHLKLIDFGHSIKIDKSLDRPQIKQQVGTNFYNPPEDLLATKYYDKIDIFQLGVLLYTMVIQEFPFVEATKYDEDYSLIYKNKFEEFWQNKNVSISLDLIELISNLLNKDPASRFTLDQIKANSWYKQEIMTPLELKAELKQRLYDHQTSSNNSSESEFQ